MVDVLVVVCLGLGRVVDGAGGRVVVLVLDVDDELEVEDDDVDDVVVPSIRSDRLSGEAVKMGTTGTPARALLMVRAQMAAGNDPPETLRPWTLVMGVILSGCPTHTAVAIWGT